MTELSEPPSVMIAPGRDVRPAEAGDPSGRDTHALSEIVQHINQSLDLERVCALVVRHAARLVRARGARLGMIEGDTLVIVGSFGEGEHGLGDRIPMAAAPAVRCARGTMTIPLAIGSRTIGVVTVSDDQRAFDANDAALIRSLAAQAAITIENAWLHRASARTTRHASILATAARGLARNVEPDAIYADIARIARSSLDADGVTIYLVNEAADAAEPLYSDGLGAEASRQRARSFSTTAGAHAARSGTAEFRANLRAHDEEPMVQRLLAEGIASVALLPLLVEGRPRGVLALRYAAPQTFDDAQRQLLLDFSFHAAVAMRNALLIADIERRSVRITEAERRRLEQQRTLATALESMEQAVFICSSSAVIRYANGAAIREYGYAFGEFVGMHARELTIRRPATLTVREPAHGSGASGGAWVGEQIQRRKDGSEFPAWVTISTIQGPDGEGMGVVVTVRNLAEEQRTAEQLRQSEKLVALGELVAGVAHEVNNPLTGISAFAQILLEEPLTPEQGDAVRLIKREADRAVGVVRDLLTFARKAEPRTVHIDLNDLIERTLRLCAYSLRTTGVTAELRLDPDLRRVQGDDRQLQQVLLNLIVNAEHAMSATEERTLTIETSNADGHVAIAVSDTGIGMTPEVQRRVFEPFFTTKSEGRGTGLGLSISYGIVHMHRGQLSVDSAPGAGATFRITLPALHLETPPTLPHTASL